MEDRIKEYEKYIADRTAGKIGPIERVKLAEYHREMVANFQHERLVHLLIMLFFVSTALILLGIFLILTWNFGIMIELLSYYILELVVTGLAIAYVKHYYFLENHIQGLYKYSKILRMGKDE